MSQTYDTSVGSDAATEVLESDPSAIAFALVYSIDRENRYARLRSAAGEWPSQRACPPIAQLETFEEWPLAKVVKSRTTETVCHLRNQAHGSDVAYVVPLIPPGELDVQAILIAGIYEHAQVSERYKSFLENIGRRLLGALPPTLATAAQEKSSGKKRMHLKFASKSANLSVLRRRLCRFLKAQGATDNEASEILIACSEAAANAIEHPVDSGRPEFEVVAMAEGLDITITVQDFGQWRAARPSMERGRGILLMEALMNTEITDDGDGSTVTLKRRIEPHN